MAYRIRDDETVSDGIRRISVGQIDRALERLTPKTRNKDRAVHEARVCFKKIRAVLRLSYGEIGRDTFKFENIVYRDAGQQLAVARDTAVLAGKLEEFAHHFEKQLANPDIKSLRKRFRRARIRHRIEGNQVFSQVAEALEAGRERVESWPLHHDGFAALKFGIRRVYRRGFVGFQLSRQAPTTENLHEWRKQVKYLWYQISILNEMWPKPLDALGRELGKLADYLSEDHDLALLRKSAIEQAETLGEGIEVDKLVVLIDQRREQLQTRGMSLGARLYTEKPKRFADRLESYWEAWRPTPAGESVKAEQLTLAAYASPKMEGSSYISW